MARLTSRQNIRGAPRSARRTRKTAERTKLTDPPATYPYATMTRGEVEGGFHETLKARHGDLGIGAAAGRCRHLRLLPDTAPRVAGAYQNGLHHSHGEQELGADTRQQQRALHQQYPAAHGVPRGAVLQSATGSSQPAQLSVARSRLQLPHLQRRPAQRESPEHDRASGDLAAEERHFLEDVSGGYRRRRLSSGKQRSLCREAQPLRLL